MLIKRVVIIFFLLFFLSFPKIIIAEETITPTPTLTPPITTTTEESSGGILSFLFGWIANIFAPKYEIDPSRNTDQIRTDMSNFGDVNKKEDEKKHYNSGNRLTSNNTQNCLQGNVIKGAVLNPRKDEVIGKICFTDPDLQNCQFIKKSESGSNCTNIKISNLAYYLLQNNTPIYCNDNNQKIATEGEFAAAIYSLNSTPIPSSQLPCYAGVYDDFFLTEQNPDNQDEEKNTIQIMKTPIPAQSQDPNDKVTQLKTKNDHFFSSQRDIDNNKAGLNNLRPASEQQ